MNILNCFNVLASDPVADKAILADVVAGLTVVSLNARVGTDSPSRASLGLKHGSFLSSFGQAYSLCFDGN